MPDIEHTPTMPMISFSCARLFICWRNIWFDTATTKAGDEKGCGTQRVRKIVCLVRYTVKQNIWVRMFMNSSEKVGAFWHLPREFLGQQVSLCH